MTLFSRTDNVSIKTLGTLRLYKDLLSFINPQLSNGASVFAGHHGVSYSAHKIGESHWRNYPLYAIEAGSDHPLAKLVVLAGHHGEETAGPMAAAHIAKEIINPTGDLAEILAHVRVAVVPCIEPEGFNWDAKLFSGNGRSGYWAIDAKHMDDINATWGSRYNARRPPEINAVDAFLQRFLVDDTPSYVIDCHETVVSSEDMMVPATLRGTSALGGPARS